MQPRDSKGRYLPKKSAAARISFDSRQKLAKYSPKNRRAGKVQIMHVA